MKREGGDFHAINIPGGFADHPGGKPLRAGKSRAGSQIFCFWKLLLRPSALALSDLFPRMRGGFQHVKAHDQYFFFCRPRSFHSPPPFCLISHTKKLSSLIISRSAFATFLVSAPLLLLHLIRPVTVVHPLCRDESSLRSWFVSGRIKKDNLLDTEGKTLNHGRN
jgi:hypothetical protein